MPITFYYAPMSTSSATEALIAELGLDCDRVRLDIDAGDTRRPEFLKLNPNGRVPTIVHDGVPIWESAAIALYLGELYGVERGLYPPPGPHRGEVMKWVVWANTHFAEAAGRLSSAIPAGPGAVQPGSVDWRPPSIDDGARAATALSDLDGYSRLLDRELSRHEYLIGRYSIADTHLWVFVSWAMSMGLDLSAHREVAAWWQRCSSRPALAGLFGD
jgi:glutathione S-transferase